MYIALLYSIIQVFFTAFPIIYESERHWSQGSAGLPYVALICGSCSQWYELPF